VSAALTLARIARRLERRANRHLPLSQFRVLALTVESDTSASRLSRMLDLSKPAVTATVDALVSDGLLLRTPVSGDRRTTRLEVTEAGRVKLAEAEEELSVVIDDLVDRCDDPALVRTALDQLGVAQERRAVEREAKRAVDEPGRA
jgi:DNA-binding MarR family transcriptional regulator